MSGLNLSLHPQDALTVQLQGGSGSPREIARLSRRVDVLYHAYVSPEMYGARGDGVFDDAPALKAALESGRPVLLTQDLYLFSKIEVTNHNVYLDGQGYTIHFDGSAFNLLREGNTLSRDHCIMFNASQYAYESPEAAKQSGHPVIEYTEAGTWQDVARWENYHRGYISYKGLNPTEGQEEYAAFDKIRAWDEYSVILQNFKGVCVNCQGLMILRLTRTCHSRVSNVHLFCPDMENDASTGIFIEQTFDTKVRHYCAENFTALKTAHLWSGGYGILANGTDVTVSDSEFINCKHPVDPGGSFDHWCIGFAITNCNFRVSDVGRVRSNGSSQFQQQIDVHPAMQDIIYENIYISWTDNRTQEEKEANGLYHTVIETEGRKARLRNVRVEFKGLHPWERLFITTSRQGGEAWLENVIAPTCFLVVSGFTYNRESGDSTYYAANFETAYHCTGCEFGAVHCGDSSVRVYLDRCTVHYFTENIAHLRANNCVFINDHFPDNNGKPLVHILDDGYFNGCEFHGHYLPDASPIQTLISAPENKAHLHGCTFYMRRGGTVSDHPQADMSGNYAQDLFACELGHLISYTVETEDDWVDTLAESAQEYDPSRVYSAGDFAIKSGQAYRCITNGATGAWDVLNHAGWSSDLKNKQIVGEYSPTARYALGVCVSHEGVIYRCVSAVETPEAWNGDHWSREMAAHRQIVRNVRGEHCEIGKVNTYTGGTISGVQFN